METHVTKMSLGLGKNNLKRLTGIAVELGIELSTKPTTGLLMRLIRNMYGERERSQIPPNNTLLTFGKYKALEFGAVPQEYLRLMTQEVRQFKNPDPEVVALAHWALAKKNQQTYHKCLRRGKKIPVLCLERLAAAHCRKGHKDKWLPLEETEKCYSYCDECRGVLTHCQFQITSKTGAHTGAGYGLSCRCLAHSFGLANYEVAFGHEKGYEVANYRSWLYHARSHTVSEKPSFQEENTTVGSTGGPSGGGSGGSG